MVKLYVLATTLAAIAPIASHAAFRGEFLLDVEENAVQDSVFVDVESSATLSADDNDKEHVNCRVSPWGAWEPCDPLTHKQTRHRLVEATPKGRGKACPHLEQTIPCKAKGCKVSHWSPWQACDDQGFRIRTREVVTRAAHGARPCPHLVDRKKCRTVDCRVCHWSEWGQCDQETGVRTRTREITHPAEFGGTPCPSLLDTVDCPVDCVVEHGFGPWSDCEDGVKTRVQGIVRPARNEGRPCPSLEDRTQTSHCPVDCVLESCDAAQGWTECDDNGHKQAPRGVAVPAKHGGQCPSQESDARQCHDTCPPVDCAFDGWQPWSECDEDGNKERKRVLKHGPKYHGKSCEELGDWTEYDTCPAEDCEMEEWSDWSECKDGNKVRSRGIKKSPKYHGQQCGSTHEEASCPVDCVVDSCANAEWNECDEDGHKQAIRKVLVPARHEGQCPSESDRTCHDSCAPIDCVLDEYTAWSDCDDEGHKTRSRRVLVHPRFHGKTCDATEDNGTCAPQDCVLDEWTAWSDCHYNTKSRSRAVVQPAKYGGRACANEYEEAACIDADCVVSDWQPWSECDASGTRTRSREIVKNCDKREHGEECPPLTESATCEPVDCVVSDWSDYLPCNEEGWHTKTRTIVRGAKYGGKACPLESELVDRLQCAKQDCVAGEWLAWGACSETSPYEKTRTRQVLLPAKWGGEECVLTDTGACSPIDCVTTEWGAWTDCDPITGAKTRTKTIATPARYGGLACPAEASLTEQGQCAKVHCVLSAWSDYGTCSGGQQTRTRTVVTSPLYGGDACGSTTQTKTCHV